MATVRLLTAVPTSGTSSQLHAFAVKSQTLMFPCWSPAGIYADTYADEGIFLWTFTILRHYQYELPASYSRTC